MNLIKASTDEIRPNIYNPNIMSSKDYDKLLYSVTRFGQILPVLVRPVEDGEVKYEIIDGEHRWKAIRDLNIPECFVIVYEQEQDLDEYKMMSIAINEIHGEIDNKLLRNILDSSVESVSEFLNRLDLLKVMVSSTNEGTDQLSKFFSRVGVDDWDGKDLFIEEPDVEAFTIMATRGEVTQLRALEGFFDAVDMKLLKGIVEHTSQRELDDDERFFLLYQLATRRAFLHRGVAFKTKPPEMFSLNIRGTSQRIKSLLEVYRNIKAGHQNGKATVEAAEA